MSTFWKDWYLVHQIMSKLSPCANQIRGSSNVVNLNKRSSWVVKETDWNQIKSNHFWIMNTTYLGASTRVSFPAVRHVHHRHLSHEKGRADGLAGWTPQYTGQLPGLQCLPSWHSEMWPQFHSRRTARVPARHHVQLTCSFGTVPEGLQRLRRVLKYPCLHWLPRYFSWLHWCNLQSQAECHYSLRHRQWVWQAQPDMLETFQGPVLLSLK